jgi:hypothetical protein
LEEERVKSAFEIAMERISLLPELTPEEIAAQKEKECAPIGNGISQRYLVGAISDGELPAELDRYPGDRQQIIRRALIAGLCRAIRLEDEGGVARKALKGMSQLASAKGGFFEDAVKDFEQILSEFEQEQEDNSREFEVLARERLRDLGISGSALRPNLNADQHWQQKLGKIRQAYEPRLDDFKQRLIQKLQSP